MEAIRTPQGMLQLNALRRLICSSGKPTLAGESGSKTDLPKLALDFRTQAHDEISKRLLSKLPLYPLRAIGHGEKADRDMGAAMVTALRLTSSLCEDALTCKGIIPMMSQRPVGGEVTHGELSAPSLEDSVRKLAPAMDYLVHSLLGMPRTNERSFGDCLEATVVRCCQSFELHLDDLFAIVDDRIFREFGERLSEWRRLSQAEAQTHHSSPFPDIRCLVDGPQVFALLQSDAHHKQIQRNIAGPCLLANRSPKGDLRSASRPRRAPSEPRRLRPARRRRRCPGCSIPAAASPQPAPAVRTGGSLRQPPVVHLRQHRHRASDR